jgi:hypothetical protein
VAPGLDSRGFNLAPSQEYTYDRGTRPRAVVGAIDVGAFEYAAGAVAFATPTATMANTPTPSPIPTATSSTPFYCASGQGEAIYAIGDSADDGVVERLGTNYNSLGAGYTAAVDYGTFIDYAVRKNAGGNYKIGLTFWRWNTATRPDGTPWPVGTQVVGAFFRPMWTGAGSGTRALVFEWHDWPPPAPLAQSNWTVASPASSAPTYAGTTARPTGKGRQTIGLSNAAARVSLSGYSGLRMTWESDPIVASGQDSTVGVRPKDFLTSAGDQSAELVLCYTQGPPQAPSAPQLY